ncbi:RNA-directed DNA polymerase, eukaryota, reverse transcriptase zinc-binding domain protein [Tanacetum coccineum]
MVGSKLVQPTITYSFRRPPRGGAEQMQTDELTTLMQNVSLTPMQDRWTWTLNASGDFSVASVRNLIDTTMLPKGEYQTRWIRVVPIKVNTFAWKVMTNSLPTRFNISRRGIDIDSISCGNCDLGVETSNHLFFTCDMAKQITRLIMRWWDVPELEIDSYTDWRNWIVNVRMPSKNKDMFEGVSCLEVNKLGYLEQRTNGVLHVIGVKDDHGEVFGANATQIMPRLLLPSLLLLQILLSLRVSLAKFIYFICV